MPGLFQLCPQAAYLGLGVFGSNTPFDPLTVSAFIKMIVDCASRRPLIVHQ